MTSFSILISAASLAYALNKDRLLRQRQQSDVIRKAAALLIAKLDRWCGLSLLLLNCIDPHFVNASEALPEAKFDHQVIRDTLWKDLNNKKIIIQERVMEENIEISYVDLYTYDCKARRYFEIVLTRLRDEEDIMFSSLLNRIQDSIFDFESSKETYNTSQFRNRLKIISDEICVIYAQRLNSILKIVNDDVLNIISQSDKDLFSKKNLFPERTFKDFPPLDSSLYRFREKPTYVYGE